jgi:hypothetical protein
MLALHDLYPQKDVTLGGLLSWVCQNESEVCF